MSGSEDGNYNRGGHGSPARTKSQSKSGSQSPSQACIRSESRSHSHSKVRSRSRRQSNPHRSNSRSCSPQRRSRTPSYSPDHRRRRSQNASPMSSRRRHTGTRENPDPSTCLGVFGLNLSTTERDLREVFSRYGRLTGINMVHDQRTGRSRGFAFIYFERLCDAREAIEHTNGMNMDGRQIRVDYSITKRPHTPTPGIYMGRPTYNGGGGGGGGGTRKRRDSYYDRSYDRYDRYERCDEYDYRYSRRRSPSPYYSRYRSRSRSYSPRRF
ncbi:transformer-2 protein homolog alpha [Oryzias latipes]|uniref:Transformer-2 protein homolog alpha n=1 Tax=Oryzias latipes TaxID=8090 RepID=A0A3B3H7T6_ORYLA|nr:transformer-2 protein homolog alpha [Oryzias latipes]